MIASGGCHCGAVRFCVAIPPDAVLLDCNCSICRKSGFLHLIVPSAQFQLEQGTDTLSTYRFGTGIARHLFCRHCGIKSFYHPRSHPDAISVNARTLDDSLDIPVRPFDGQNWENARAALDR